jgi:hypothetical protein
MYVYGHKLRYGNVPGTNTSTYPILEVPSLKWSIRASLPIIRGRPGHKLLVGLNIFALLEKKLF